MCYFITVSIDPVFIRLKGSFTLRNILAKTLRLNIYQAKSLRETVVCKCKSCCYYGHFILNCINIMFIINHFLKHFMVVFVYCLQSVSFKLSGIIYSNATSLIHLWTAVKCTYFENLLNTCANY